MTSLLKRVARKTATSEGVTPPLAEVNTPPQPPAEITKSNVVPEPAQNGGGAATAKDDSESDSDGAEQEFEDAESQDDNLVTAEQLDLPSSQLQDTSEQGKFKVLLSILRKALNVKDLSGLRISLPAQLMDPVANLDFWCYQDRPDLFAAIGDSDDELERMLAVVRWVFTKDLKFIKQRIMKPYNSVLGEHFHAHWDVTPVPLHSTPTTWLDENPSAEAIANAGRKSGPSLPTRPEEDETIPSGSSGSATLVGSSSSTSSSTPTASAEGGGPKARVIFLNEQVSHHPPISHFMLESRGAGGRVRAYGADQVSAKFTGTNVKVFPGPFNRGIFLSLPDRTDSNLEPEEYQITHPTANIAGLLRGNPYATIGDACCITRTDGQVGEEEVQEGKSRRLRTILAYTEESWLTRSKFAVQGIIYSVNSPSDTSFTKLKQVPSAQIVATISGCWRGEIRYKLSGDSTSRPLIDLLPLLVHPKTVAPLETQEPLESHKVWDPVSRALRAKDFSAASKAKTAIEQKQRDEAEARKKSGVPYKPRFFEPASEDVKEWDGRPRLTKEGLEAVEKQFKVNPTDATTGKTVEG